MAPNIKSKRGGIDDGTQKILDQGMHQGMIIMGMPKELMPMACPRQDQREVLAKGRPRYQLVGKRGGL